MLELEAQEEESEASARACDATGDLGAAQSHADDAADVRRCINAREVAEGIPGVLAAATLRDLTEEVRRNRRIKAPSAKAASILGALVAARIFW
jgi:hypothetical protein